MSSPPLQPAPLRLRRRPPVGSSPQPSRPTPSPRVAFDDVKRGLVAVEADGKSTPVRLRELEAGWRIRRRAGGGRSQREASDSEGTARGNGRRSTVWTPVKDGGVGLARAAAELHVVSKHGGLLTPPSSPELHSRSQRPLSVPSVLDHPRDPGRPRLPNNTSCPPPLEDTSLRPILASPLPPTTRPSPLLRRAGGRHPQVTILVHEPGETQTNEVTIRYSHKRVVRVTKGGRELRVQGDGREMRTLSLDEQRCWTAGEREEWKLVSEVVESFKRITPRVKVYHPLGHLTITCSTPPDLILSFVTAASAGTRPSRDDDTQATTRVRLTYSRIGKEIRIDTATRHAGGEGSFKSSRVAPLHLQSVSAAVNSDSLGVDERVVGGWTVEERDALARLWRLRDEWRRYDIQEGDWEGA